MAAKKKAATKKKAMVPKKTMDMTQWEGATGMEEADADSFAIPFLRILQSGSPECKRSDGKYIPGAQEGNIFHTTTGKLYDGEEGVRVVPCYFRREMLEWVLREDGGGLRGRYTVANAPSATSQGDPPRLLTAAGTELKDTRAHFCLLLDVNGIESCLIAMSSTQIKKSRQLMTLLNHRKALVGNREIKPPSFTCSFKLTTVPESNDKGSWYGWNVEPLGDLDAEEINVAEAGSELYASVRAGAVDVRYEEQEEAF